MSEGSNDEAVNEATAIAMDRYDMSETSARGVLGRVARRHKVELRVVALAVIAAAVARRLRDSA